MIITGMSDVRRGLFKRPRRASRRAAPRCAETRRDAPRAGNAPRFSRHRAGVSGKKGVYSFYMRPYTRILKCVPRPSDEKWRFV